jgi:acyl-CoA thioesterase II
MSSGSLALTSILRSFVLERTSDSRWRAPSVHNEKRPVILGGQLLGQMILAATAARPGKRVKSLQVVFVRAGSVASPVELDVATLHDGRALGTLSVTASQGERLLAPGLALMDTGEPDVIRHQPPMPDVPDADEVRPARLMTEEGTELRIVGDVDIRTSAATGPAELQVWARFDTAPLGNGGTDQAVHQALLSWWTDPLLIGAAMRPHEGFGQEQAHETLSTGVLTHAITFHEESDASQWHLFTNESIHAGHGRTYGTGSVFGRDGRLVASFAQESMIRRFRAGDPRRGAAVGAM